MAMWMQKVLLTVMAAVPVIAGEIVRIADGAGAVSPAAPSVIAPRRAADCPLSELRWRTLDPPSAVAPPATVARASGVADRGC